MTSVEETVANSIQSSSPTIEYLDYVDESVLPDIQLLVSRDLSEPYSVFTYRYFLQQWPSLCICVYAPAKDTGIREMIGTIICKAAEERDIMQGYIAMLTVNKDFRKLGIGRKVCRSF